MGARGVNRYPDCPRHCIDCNGQDHHWMLDYDDDYPDEPIMACKHCPAQRLVGDDEDGNEPDYIPRLLRVITAADRIERLEGLLREARDLLDHRDVAEHVFSGDVMTRIDAELGET